MAAVLIESGGKSSRLGDGLAEDVLREHDAQGQVVHLNVTDDDGTTFGVWMAIDPAQPVNATARRAITHLSALHVMCFGPVVIGDLDDDTALELTGG